MLRGARIRLRRAVGGGVVQPRAQADRPAHRGAGAAQDSEPARRARPTPWSCTGACACPTPRRSASATPHQVSGGQLQRAMTAMAMSCRPDLIIFDEPTTALDVTTQIEVLAAIRDIVDQFSTAALYITHESRSGRTDGRPHQGAAQGRRNRGSGHPFDARGADRRTTPSRCGRCAASSASRSRWPVRTRHP